MKLSPISDFFATVDLTDPCKLMSCFSHISVYSHHHFFLLFYNHPSNTLAGMNEKIRIDNHINWGIKVMMMMISLVGYHLLASCHEIYVTRLLSKILDSELLGFDLDSNLGFVSTFSTSFSLDVICACFSMHILLCIAVETNVVRNQPINLACPFIEFYWLTMKTNFVLGQLSSPPCRHISTVWPCVLILSSPILCMMSGQSVIAISSRSPCCWF